MAPEPYSTNTKGVDNFVDAEDIDQVSVHLGNDIVLLARKNGSVCMDLSFRMILRRQLHVSSSRMFFTALREQWGILSCI